MHSLQQQQIFEKLRSRFGARKEGFGPATGPSPMPSTFPDAILKTGLHECLGQGPGDWPSVLGFALSAASQQETRKPIFILSLKSTLQELGQLYGHGLTAFGLDAAQVIAVSVKAEKDLLWAAEEIVVSAVGTVITTLDAKERLYSFTASRRLKLRTESTNTPVFVLRHWSQEGATSAHTRWRIARLPSTPEKKTPGTELLGTPRLCAVLERGQGWSSSRWEMAYHASDGFRVASLSANGASRTDSASRQAA